MERITITVKTNARKTEVELLPDGTYRVAVNEPALDGRANEAVVAALATFLGVRKSALKIVLGHHFKKKVIEVTR